MNRLSLAIALAACTSAPLTTGTTRGAATGWVATWAASPHTPDIPKYFEHQTLRMIVHASLGGSIVRLRLSNRYGTHAAELASVHVAMRTAGDGIRPQTDRAVTFSGRATVTLAPGEDAISDPVALAVSDAADLAISIYAPGAWIGETVHAVALETTTMSRRGEFATAEPFPTFATDDSWYLVAGVDVQRSDGAAVVAFGDSITDGVATTPETNHRWPNLLAARLARRPGNHTSVVDAGISGNRLLHDTLPPHARTFFGEAGLARFDHDALAQPGARYVIVLLGINDIGQPKPTELVSADDMIAGLQELARRAHARHVKIFIGTLLPFAGAGGGYYTPEKGQIRERVNAWIRSNRVFDATLDFDRALQDPEHPDQLRPTFDSGDHLHPGDAGQQAIADAVDLAVFD